MPHLNVGVNNGKALYFHKGLLFFVEVHTNNKNFNGPFSLGKMLPLK